jgi:hypothetical protein
LDKSSAIIFEIASSKSRGEPGNEAGKLNNLGTVGIKGKRVSTERQIKQSNVWFRRL